MDYSRHDAKPPANDEQIARVETWFGANLPTELADILRESNGVALWREPKEVQVLSTVEMIEFYEVYGFANWMPGTLPWAMDGSGNFLVLKQNAGPAVYVVSAGNLGWEDAIKIADTMREFFEDTTRPEDYLYSQSK